MKTLVNILFNPMLLVYITGFLMILMGKASGSVLNTFISYTWGVTWVLCAIYTMKKERN